MVVSETTPPLHVHKERQKKEAAYSRLVGTQFNKQGNVHTGACLGKPGESRSLHPSAKMLNIYIEALIVFSHGSSPDGPNNTLLSLGASLKMALAVRTVGRRFQGQNWG